MQTEALSLEMDLAQSFLVQHPAEAAKVLEKSSLPDIIRHLESEAPQNAASLLERLEPDAAANAIAGLPDEPTRAVLPLMNPVRLAVLLTRLDDDIRARNLSLLDAALGEELQRIMAYPPDTAGALMDPRFSIYRSDATARDITKRMHTIRKRRTLDVLVMNEDGGLAGLVPLQDVILSEPDTPLHKLIRNVPPSVNAMASRSEVVELLTQGRLTTLPVVDPDMHVLGVIRYDGLVQAAREEATLDMQRMVGVGKDERALSPALFSVRKRLPWLNINLLTAFLAAAVVGMFESTIASVTALAVLLPVVAGQSGNTGAQALAVTMRGLALREVRISQWPRLLRKEAAAGFMNGVAIAIVTGIGVLLWSKSVALSLIIFASMIMAMVIAGVAGAAIPIILTSIRQDPAQSSSIILTTVTDVMGFLSFLGLASIFVKFL